ncbi:BTAD domain-containing putative transcriptional regulator [Dactylosporangium sp. NPDC051485]|uniref:BTAD domain-containing putative transcriptional regulator n=1 Tax=Dactylosporangium sp. NPDC051485 TaxID=3154846 RepID=UPI0034161F9A
MELRILGPLEAIGPDGAEVDLGTPKQRAVLAMLATQPGRVVPVQRLIDELWADEPPQRALASLQAYVSRLRRALEPGRSSRDRSAVLVTRAPGYLLAVPGSRVDAARLAAAVQSHRPGDDPAGLTAALALWRGDPLPELGDSPLAQAERARLQELRFTAIEARSEALLALGREADVVYAGEAALAEFPYRERLWCHLVLALYRTGRRADALAACARARALLIHDLGIEPGPALQRLESDILRDSPALGGPAGPSGLSAPAPAPAEVRAPQEPAGLVGRDRELAAIDRILDAPGGRVLLVCGGAGIGKSALLREAAARATARGYAVGAGSGVQGPRPPVFLPWAQALRGVAQSADEGAVVGAFAPYGNLPAVLDPALAEVLPLPAPERLADAELARSRLYRGIVDGLGRLSAAVPLLLILDDAHLLDAPSTTLLTLCARAVAGSRITLAVGFRAAEAPDAVAGLAGEAHAVQLRLEGLTTADVATLAARRTATPVAAETVGVLMDRTGGNPFFVEELLQVLVAEHALDAEAARRHVPARVQEVLRRRLARLPEQSLAVLAVAAVLGREFDVPVLREMTMTDELELYDALDTAVATGILAATDDPGRLRFAHDLLRQAAYLDQGPLRRARLHARAAEAVRRTGGSATAMAAHLRPALPAVPPMQAAPVFAAAAGEAYERTAHAEAASLLAEALAVLLNAPRSQERDVLELDLRVRLAYVHQSTDEYLAAPVAEQYDLMEPVLRRVRPVPQIVPALWGYASYHTAAGNPGRVADLARPGAEEPWARIVADVHAGYAALLAADLAGARRLFGAALAALPGTDLPVFPIIGWDPIAGILGPAAATESLMGDAAAAEAHLRAARGRRGELFQEMYVSYYTAIVAADRLDAAAVEPAAAATLELAGRGGHPEYRGMARVLLGWARADEPVLALGERELGPALWRYPRLLPLRPGLVLALGRPAEAAALATERLATPLDGLNRFAEPDLRRILGEASGDRGQLTTALRLARALGHVPAAERAEAALAAY